MVYTFKKLQLKKVPSCIGWYLCTNCEEVLSISAGTPCYLQEWALENRLTLETWSD